MSGIAFLLVLGSAACHAAWNLAAKRCSANSTVVLMAPSLVVFGLLPFTWRFLRWGEIVATWELIGLTALIHVVYLLALSYAYKHWEISVIYPIARGLAVVIAAGFGIGVLGDLVNGIGILGMGLVVLGILIQGSDGVLSAVKHVSIGTILAALFIGALVGGYLIVDRIGIMSMNPLGYVVAFQLGMLGLMSPYLLLFRREEVVDAFLHYKRYLIFIGGGAILSYTLALVAFLMGSFSYPVALRECSIVFVALFGVLVFREQLSLKKGLAVGVIVLGAVLIRLG